MKELIRIKSKRVEWGFSMKCPCLFHYYLVSTAAYLNKWAFNMHVARVTTSMLFGLPRQFLCDRLLAAKPFYVPMP